MSFEVDDGACLAVSGPSGAGKTLLLRAIADLDPAEGAVELDGTGRGEMPATWWRRMVGYVATDTGWWDETVAAHFADWEQAAELAAPLGLAPECGAWPVARLSTGERQRLGLVRALVLAPRALLLDEPTSGLDPDGEAAAEALVAAFRAGGGAVVWVTHDAAQAARVAGARARMEGGRMAAAA